MGIKDLMNNLHMGDVFEDTTLLQDNSSIVIIDFYSVFYNVMYAITTEEKIDTLPSLFVKKIHGIRNKKLVLMIDVGSIPEKDDERDRRKQRKPNPIELLIMDNKLLYIERILEQLDIQDKLNFHIGDNPQSMAESIEVSRGNCVVYSHCRDAEYSMVMIGNYLQREESVIIVDGNTYRTEQPFQRVTYLSGDQDLVALLIINQPKAYFIYQGSYYRLRQDECDIQFAQLITLITTLCNKSDYFLGIYQLTAGTFLKNLSKPYTFNIKEQANSLTVLEENIELMTDLIREIKQDAVKPCYITVSSTSYEFTTSYCRYVQKVCQYLSLCYFESETSEILHQQDTSDNLHPEILHESVTVQ